MRAVSDSEFRWDKKRGRTFETDAMFGEVGVLSKETVRICAFAITSAVLIHVDGPTVRSALDYDLRLNRGLIDSVVSRMQRFIDTDDVTPKVSTHVRIAVYLLKLSASKGQDQSSLLLPASKTTISSMLKMTPESLSRSFRRLIDMGIIRISGRRVYLRDWTRLAAMAQSSKTD